MPSVSDELFSPVPNGTPSSRLPSTPSCDFISPSTRRQHSRLSYQSPLLNNVPVNDDDKERRQRRQSKVLEMQRGLQSPVVTPGDRRRLSIGTGSFTNTQVIEHYANCIKLSAENKINAKNAFSLNLIDHMSELIKQKEKSGGMTNFQVASCTLDASAKIYAGRVDSIFADTYKMLGGLGRDNEKPSQDANADGGDDDENTTKKKKHKRTTKKSKIESNLKNIKRKQLEMDFEVDPLFKQTSSEFDAGGVSGLLLGTLGLRDDGCEVLLDMQTVADISSLPCSRDENCNPVDLSDFAGLYRSLNLENTKICPEFSVFKFSNWDDSEENPISRHLTDPSKNEHAFDVNAVPEPIEEMPADDDAMPDFGGGGDYSDDDDAGSLASDATDRTVMLADGKEARPIQDKDELGKVYQRVITDGTMGQLCLLIAQEQTDFSFFNLDMLKTWAGPKHWKMKAKSKELANKNDAKKTKKPAFALSYDKEENFDKFFKVTKASTTLTKSTVEKWNEGSTTLPQDLDYNPDKLFSLFIKTNVMLKRQVQSNSEGLDDGIDNYNYENENDCNNFCPGVQGDDDDDDNDMSAGGMDFTAGDSEFSQTAASQNPFGDSLLENTQILGDNLVAQPNKVAKIDIQYAKTAKKMDVKRLKSSMWNVLTTSQVTEKENAEVNDQAENSKVAGTQSFKQMYGVLPTKISSNMAKNLSISMCFVCLLHLANEKNLKIDGVETFGDLLISQDG